METLSDIRDMSNTSSIFDSFKQIGRYFWVICNSPSISIFSVPDAAWERAVAVLHPVAFYVQMKAPDSVKEQLGEMLAADSEVIDRICEGILFPFIKGQFPCSIAIRASRIKTLFIFYAAVILMIIGNSLRRSGEVLMLSQTVS